MIKYIFQWSVCDPVYWLAVHSEKQVEKDVLSTAFNLFDVG